MKKKKTIDIKVGGIYLVIVRDYDSKDFRRYHKSPSMIVKVDSFGELFSNMLTDCDKLKEIYGNVTKIPIIYATIISADAEAIRYGYTPNISTRFLKEEFEKEL